MRSTRTWLFKSEPDVFSYEDLERAPDQTAAWEGVRNYQARNFLRDDVKRGDQVLFYHSRIEPIGVVGTAEVVQEAAPDPTQFDPASQYYDRKASLDAPRWFLVHIRATGRLARPVRLAELKKAEGLEAMLVIRKGMMLSIQPVTPEEWRIVCELGSR